MVRSAIILGLLNFYSKSISQSILTLNQLLILWKGVFKRTPTVKHWDQIINSPEMAVAGNPYHNKHFRNISQWFAFNLIFSWTSWARSNSSSCIQFGFLLHLHVLLSDTIILVCYLKGCVYAYPLIVHEMLTSKSLTIDRT